MDKVGDVLPSMTDVFTKGFDQCVAANKPRREPYYILVTADWYANYTQLKMVFSPRATKPPILLNTMLWLVDNKAGSVEEIWVLPKDAPVGPTVPLGPVDEKLIKVAPLLPIFYY